LFWVFITGIIVLFVGAVAALVRKHVGPFILAFLVFLGAWTISSVGTVDTKNVGVVTSFKKPTGETYEAGAYWKAPWKDVTDMSLAWQTDTYQFTVQAAAGTTVGLDIRPRWRMTRDAAPDLFQNHKDFQSVKDNLFKNELLDASNKLFASYNPLTNLNTDTGQPIKTKEQWASELQTELNKRFLGKVEINGKGEQTIQKIEVDRLAIITIAPDKDTQEKLNQQVAEFGRGKILDQQKTNADKEKLITETNAKVDKQTRCLEIAEKVNGEPGLCLSGGGAGIIVNSKK
jgi:regulator of protease activity HflC (stomatin/prohibitin superfamily)